MAFNIKNFRKAGALHDMESPYLKRPHRSITLLRQWAFLLLLVACLGCEDTNLLILADAGVDAVNAVTLSDEDVRTIAVRAAAASDSEHQPAPPGSVYGGRLQKLVAKYSERDGITFNYKVYPADTINAFAMADGSIRIFSGLMDIMTDEELLFVIGHEIGHVVNRHSHKKVKLAYASSAVRKGLASQENQIGRLAGSTIGILAQQLANAQFSQHEERQADDYGVSFLEKEGYDSSAAISALLKFEQLAGLHTFLSSHPDPAERAERLAGQTGAVEPQDSFFTKLFHIVKRLVVAVVTLIQSLL